MPAYGSLVRKVREEAGISLRQLARYLGVTPTYVSDVERGYRAPFVDEVTIKVADYIGANADRLLRLAEEERLRSALTRDFPALSDGAIGRMVRIALKDLQGG